MAAVTKAEIGAAPNGKKWHDLYPELGTGPVPIEPYISQEYFELERERIFRKVWLNVGREELLSKSGDYFVKDLPMAKTSLLVVRGKDGRIVLFTTCAHIGVTNSSGAKAAHARTFPVNFTAGPITWTGS